MHLERLLYQTKNWKANLRALRLGSYIAVEGLTAKIVGATDGRMTLAGTVSATLTRANPKWYQARKVYLGVISKRVVTTAFVNYLRDYMNAAAGAANISTFRYHECGTGVVAEAIGDTALGTPCTTVLNPASTRAAGTQVGSTAKTYSSVGTLIFSGTAAVTEHGLFNTAATGILMDRSVFAAINVVNLDSIQFTYTLTIADGG